MPKLKTHKGVKKRIRVTRTGKVIRRRAGKSHLLSKKRSKSRRQLRKSRAVRGRAAKTLVKLLATKS
jgi:large subunit ribosomal protein L35